MKLFKPQFRTLIFQKFLLSGGSSVIALLMCEAALQFALPSMRGKGYYFMPPNHRTLFRPRPGIMPGISGDSNFVTNSNGIRGDEFTTQDSYRILAVGGRTTECSYLDQSETWTHLLQENLSGNTRNQKVWVGDAGLSGTTSRHHLVAMQHLPLREMKINAVILLIGINDLSVRLSHDKDYVPNFLEKPEVKK